MIESLLQQLGFSEKEIAVYLAVLKHGKITPAEVGKLTHINRSTVYSIAKELIDRGVITEDLGSSQRHLIAMSPDSLHRITARAEKRIDEQKRIVPDAIAELESMTQSTKYTIPKIVFISEENLNDYLYKRSSTWDKSVTEKDNVWWGFQDHTFVEHYETWLDWHWLENPTRAPNLEVRLLSNQSGIEEAMKEKPYQNMRKIKFWNASQNFTATTWITGDYVVMIQTQEKPHYLIEIHDALMAYNLRELFKGIWNSLAK